MWLLQLLRIELLIKKVAPTHSEPVGGGPTTRSKTTNAIANDSPPPMCTWAVAKGKMTPTKRGRLQCVAEDLMGISTIDFYNYVSENSPTQDFERAYTTLGFGDEPLSREEAMAHPDWGKWNKAENIEYKALKDWGTFIWVPNR